MASTNCCLIVQKLFSWVDGQGLAPFEWGILNRLVYFSGLEVLSKFDKLDELAEAINKHEKEVQKNSAESKLKKESKKKWRELPEIFRLLHGRKYSFEQISRLGKFFKKLVKNNKIEEISDIAYNCFQKCLTAKLHDTFATQPFH